MANIKHRMQSTLHNLYQQGRGQKKKEDPNHRFIHSKVTLQTYLREVDRFSDWLKAQGVKMRCTEQEAARQVPAYLQSLIQAGRSPNTVHTAAAALCKALPGCGLAMSQLPHPRRTHAPKKGRGAAQPAQAQWRRCPVAPIPAAGGLCPGGWPAPGRVCPAPGARPCPYRRANLCASGAGQRR